MDITLIEQDQDQFSVVVEFDALNKDEQTEETTSGMLAYEVRADDATEATLEALTRTNQYVQENWRETARLYNVRVSTVFLTDEVRASIQSQMEQASATE